MVKAIWLGACGFALLGLVSCRAPQAGNQGADQAVVGRWVPADNPVGQPPATILTLSTDHDAVIETHGQRGSGTWRIVKTPVTLLYVDGRQLVIDEGQGVSVSFAIQKGALIYAGTRARFVRRS